MTETSMRVNVFAWLIQFFLAIVFFTQGIFKFYKPEGLPQPLEWVYDLSGGFAIFIGVMELLAVVGLIVPGVIRRFYWATPIAAAGLIIVMVGAMVWHLNRGEPPAQNIILALMCGLLIYIRRGWLKTSAESPQSQVS